MYVYTHNFLASSIYIYICIIVIVCIQIDIRGPVSAFSLICLLRGAGRELGEGLRRRAGAAERHGAGGRVGGAPGAPETGEEAAPGAAVGRVSWFLGRADPNLSSV